MLGKLFGKKKEAAKAKTASPGADKLIDEDETIVIDLTSEDHPDPDAVRLQLDEPPERPAPPPETAPPTAAAGEDDTEIWTGPGAPEAAGGLVSDAADTNSHLTAGWLVITSENGRGRSFPVKIGRNNLGRGADNAISVQIGDTSISKDNHVTVAADPKTKRFFAIPGDSTNFAYLNDEPLLEPKELEDKAILQIGATVFTFVQFAGNYIAWE